MPEKINTEIVNNKNINNKLKNIKVLVVEDDEFLRQLVGRKLGDAGFDIKTAIDAQNAFNVLKDFKPDIILLDLILPGLDGFQILTKIKKDKSIADVPVIILSNLGQKEDVDKAMALGATDFLVKAYFTLDEIVKKIYNILDKK
ncbi:response regulator [Candidatus Falkowbacteria bacterium CG_4_9_14_3_um_filter_36_9]|uniref:Response regulator n=1 Tax=Candidatus Falkowbacteria bacterium CG02_land_8_20_14_3_00_36_14 TaxID=1974560 RepID=A0A2M7DQ47_9BACT|nr:MAG: response regulator [Candidatus Falkowbacteria bacterium CG02_land_8_20_14_3_00_36_14]PIX12091.1 MAG: response regulator [Candidatus Falkowbacteria bacterium CG_4_8_14_3_um_filter_36_11]PJA10865.1 MAG: response regulator [Candidatus Falkowbacteria bacterium CG_4_10_14_0_2_um_filter_36_22]PJB20237.1 MAG: response regulator [Candidatus Falkowbacteria bacterium CG_4_9_14_3_um_filter_36_9]